MLGDETTEDQLLGGRVRLAQPKQGYRAGIDPVFLAASVPAQAGETVLDVGAGAGAAALCLAVRVPGVVVAGIESDLALVRLASDNARANGVADRVRFITGDLRVPPARLAPASFDHVMANPPYLTPETVRLPKHPGKTAATIEQPARLDDWLRFCLLMARPSGTITVIYRADRLDDLLQAWAGRLGGITIFPLWPGGETRKPAKRVIVQGHRGSAAPLSLVEGLVLHQPNGHFTDGAERVLRHAGALIW